MKGPDDLAGSGAVYGSLALVTDRAKNLPKWMVDGKAMMLSKLKRIFARPASAGPVRLDATPSNAEELLWFLQRYPLSMTERDRLQLEEDATSAVETRERMGMLRQGDLVGAGCGPTEFSIKMLLPLREYQVAAVEMLRLRQRLLVGDDLGLGKTAVALGAHAAGMGPTIVVCQTHLQEQWKREAEKFLFGVQVHVVKSRKVYELPTHDFLIVPYSKVATWADFLSEGGYGLLVFDEAQELRRPDSQKSRSCRVLSLAVDCCLGLTATPIYNYGEEFHHVAEAIDPGVLGSFEEFTREWCSGMYGHWAVRDPAMLHEFVVDELGFFLRRRRADVDRELPPVTKVVESIEADGGKLSEVKGTLARLAESVLTETDFFQKGKAARELDLKMRQATGVAKAVAVAEYVMERVRAGERVVLGGWHRAVYDVWEAVFEQEGRHGGQMYRTAMYTGSESAVGKQSAVDRFVNGEVEILILSLRSGAGLDGLQKVSSLVVFGELDWSPQVHDQFIGRLNRDGQLGNVTAVYLVCDEGSDPVIGNVLGLKREQSEGLVDGAVLEAGVAPEGSRAEVLAREVLEEGGAPAAP